MSTFKTRLYGPAKTSNPMDRDVLYPETDSESVLMPNETFLKDEIGPKTIHGSAFSQPANAYREVLFFKRTESNVPNLS